MELINVCTQEQKKSEEYAQKGGNPAQEKIDSEHCEKVIKYNRLDSQDTCMHLDNCKSGL